MGKPSLFQRITNGFRNLSRLQQVLLAGFLAAGLTTAVVAFSLVRQFVLATPSFSLPGISVQQGSGGEDGGSTVTGSDVYHYPVPEPWDGSSRVNVLVLGLDARDWETGAGAPRSDTMMLVSFDPQTNTAAMLSIPRDLWVEIPGFGHDKINNAYANGEGARLPGGGPGLAVKTVESLLGIKINYYAQIDFGAFERFIDLIGGVKLVIPKDTEIQIIGEYNDKNGNGVSDPGEGITRVLQASPERVLLNGAYALAYARSRHAPDHTNDNGDFDRADRQQQVILAIKQQLERPDVLALMLNNALNIYQELSSGINTNMSLGEALSLGFAAIGLEPENVTQAVIAYNDDPNLPDYVVPSKSPDGLDILLPITENIRLLRDQVFNSGSVQSAVAANSESAQLMQQEAASIAVNNGSNISGLADSTRAFLQSRGFNVISTGNSDLVGATTLIDYTGNPYTLAYLVELLGVNPAFIFSRYDPNSQVDVEVIIGPEWTVPTQ